MKQWCGWVWLGALSALACGGQAEVRSSQSATQQAPQKADSAKQPVDFNALLAREVVPNRPQPFTSLDGTLKGAIEGKQAPTVAYEKNFMTITSPIGSEASLICHIYEQDIHPGAGLSNILKTVTQTGKIAIVKIAVNDVDVIANAGAIYVTVVYQTDQNGQKAVGTLKLFLHGGITRGVVCLHDEVGYAKTFSRITRGLVESLTYPSRLAKPRLVEVVRAKLGEQVIGFAQSQVIDSPKGVRLTISSSARVMPVAPAEVSTSDSVAIEAMDPSNHKILNGQYDEYESGAESLSLKLESVGKNGYHYKGTTHNKPIEGDFKTKDKAGLFSGLVHDEAVAKLVRDKKKSSLKFEEYDPDSDPTQTEQVVATVDGPARRATLKWERLTLDKQLDENGYALGAQGQIGKVTLSMERLLRSGGLQ